MKTLAGVDVGGTFTDLAMWDSERDVVRIHKLLTTPDDPTAAIMAGLEALSPRTDVVVHGTTLVTNALIERRGVPTGLITTDGYRDVLEIGTELRYDTFDLFLERPDPLVPRHLRVAVAGRIDAEGREVVPLDEDAVREAGAQLVAEGAQAIAVAFFNSYRNPAHEKRATEILAEVCPEGMVCGSYQVAPEIREYERFSTASANAYVQPLASRYLSRLAEMLGVPLMVILSDGGITSAKDASVRPIALVESGPAAGAMAAAHASLKFDWGDVVAFDMGGTTAKVSLVHGGVPDRSHMLEVARVHRFEKGSGLPLRVSTINLIEIGAGGGSIAAVDELGLLKVGPRSAGAAPGPACYGRGGSEPTVTDADLILGYLSSTAFLGGAMTLDVAAAEEAFDRLGDRLGIDRVAAAAGVVEVVNNNMATAARLHIAEQGRDPRGYRMIAFGGAGPVHAYGVARLLHMSTVVFQRGAGVASAIGMLVAPRSVECTGSLITDLADPDWDAVTAVIADLKQRGTGLLHEAGVDSSEISHEVYAEMRYFGQGYEVTVPVSPGVVEERDAAALNAAFEAQYADRFGRRLGATAEVMSWRVRALAAPVVERVAFDDSGAQSRTGSATMRAAYFPEIGDFVDTPVYARSALAAGARIEGPALIEETESTVVVGPAGSVLVDDSLNLIMNLERV